MLKTRTVTHLLLATAVALSTATIGTGTALASHDQQLFFEAPSQLLYPGSRPGTIEQMQHLGVKAVRIEMPWYAVAPARDSATKPRLDASNPASYEWGSYDSLLTEMKRLHWRVLLTISPPAPRWATSNGQAPYVTRPDDQDFREFMTAVGRHYGSIVSDYAFWNEPNEYNSLRPQFDGKGNPAAPIIYRGLFQAGYAGLQAAGVKAPKTLMGETGPGGFVRMAKGVPGYSGVAPLAFLRGALCLSSDYRKAKTCSRLPAYGYAQHPYASNEKGPFYRPSSPEGVTIGTVGRLVDALDKAGKAGAIKSGAPVFLTEFGVMSKPNRYFGVSVSQQAEYDAIAERIAWENPRVACFSQYLLRDDALTKIPGDVTFQTGLEYANGAKKPLFYGFPVPLTVTYARHGYSLWGLARLAGKPTTVTVLVQRPHSRRFTFLTNVHTGALGYWTLKSRVKGSHWRVRWTSPSGVRYEGPPVGAYRAP
jgi:hypothetical protein